MARAGRSLVAGNEDDDLWPKPTVYVRLLGHPRGLDVGAQLSLSLFPGKLTSGKILDASSCTALAGAAFAFAAATNQAAAVTTANANHGSSWSSHSFPVHHAIMGHSTRNRHLPPSAHTQVNGRWLPNQRGVLVCNT